MEVSREEFNRVHAQLVAQNQIILSILMFLRRKEYMKKADVEVMIETSLAAVDMKKNHLTELIAQYIEDFRGYLRE